MPKDGTIRAASAPVPDGNASLRVALVRQFPLLANVARADCEEIVSAAREKEFARRDTIFLEGDAIQNVTLLISGSAKLMQLGKNGAEVILRLVGPGDLVGITSKCAKCRHCSTAQALSACTALVWEPRAFESLMGRFHVLGQNVANTISHCLQELEERYREISTEKVSARLSHELVRLFDKVGSSANTNSTLEIKLSREELAQLTGTTLFTVSRLLSEWDQRGLLSIRRESVSVHNLQPLRELAKRESE